MNNNTLKIVIATSVVIMGAALGLAFYLSFERKKKEVRVPPSGEARKNPYLALERLLARHEIPTETVTTRAEPDADKHLIFLADDNVTLTPRQREQWLEWLRSGGHLAVAVPPESQATSPFLDSLGYTYTDPDDGDIEHTAIRRQSYSGPEDETWTFTRTIAWQSEKVDWLAEGEFEVGSNSDPLDLLEDEESDESEEGDESDTEPETADDGGEADGDEESETEIRTLAVSRPLGNGRVTLLHSMSMFENTSIGQGERASLAIDIASKTNPMAERRGASIVRYSARRSWAWYVLSHTWPMAAAGAILVLLALLQGRYRFGPLVPPPPQERRSRTEHIRAMGRFLWDRDGGTALIEATREALVAELERKHPSLTQLSGADRRRRIQSILELDREEVDAIFENPHNLSPDQFQTRIQLMERYRRNL